MSNDVGTSGSDRTAASALGDFQLIREIGRGGCGVVWEAWQTSLRRRVALKILSPSFAQSDAARERFRREAEAGARLQHPAIVAVHAIGETDGTLYIAEELVEDARTLADWFDEVRRAAELPRDHYRRVAELFAQVAEALQAAHSAGIVHRDVKPTNVLIAPGGSPKVVDFGIARLDSALTLSRTGELLGTPYYMSPEQIDARFGTVGPQSDVFALGVTLFEALTFVRPFEGDTSHQVLQHILSSVPVDPRKLRSRVPRDLAVICSKALEKKPAHRYATMAELAADLRRYLANEPIRASPPGFAQTAVRWCSRHPVVSAGSAIALTALTIIFVLWLQVREQARTSQRTLDFVIASFAGSDPNTVGGRVVDVSTLLDRAAAKVSGTFEGEPRIEAQLRHAFGILYESLGEYPKSYEQLTRYLELREAESGSQAVATLVARNLLGATATRLKRFDEAEEHLRAATAGLDTVLAPSAREACAARYNLGVLLLQSGRAEEAQEQLQPTLAYQLAEQGAESVDTLKTASALASTFIARGNSVGAAELASHYLERAREAPSAGVMTISSLQMTLAMALQQQERYADAEVQYRELLGRLDANVVAEHPHRQAVLVNLGTLNMQLGRPREAAETFRALLDVRRRTLGERDPAVASVLTSLGLAESRCDELTAAEEHLRSALEILEAKAPESDRTRLSAMTNLAELLLRTERAADAEPMCRAAWEVRRRSPGPDHPDTLYTQEVLTRVLVRLNRTSDAAELARDLLERTPTDSPTRAAREQLTASLDSVRLTDPARSSTSGSSDGQPNR